MWDKFGEFDSADEINGKAKELRDSDHPEEVMKLAKENGIMAEMAEIFITAGTDILCDCTEAAFGKLSVELENYDKRYIANAKEVVQALESLMAQKKVRYEMHMYGIDISIDITGEQLAEQIRKNGKHLNTILKDVFTKAQKIHSEGNPASALVIPMVIEQYMKEGK